MRIVGAMSRNVPRKNRSRFTSRTDHPGLGRDSGERAAGDLRDLVQRD